MRRARAVFVEPGSILAVFHTVAEIAARRPRVVILLALIVFRQLALPVRGDLLMVGRAGVAGVCEDRVCGCGLSCERAEGHHHCPDGIATSQHAVQSC